jgi:ArsR family transcriptional regulator
MNNEMKNITRVLKAVSDRNRLRIVNMLAHKKSVCVCEIGSVLGISQSTTSRHLKILENAGLIYSTRDGKWVDYHISLDADDAKVREFLAFLVEWMKEDKEFTADRSKISTTDRNVLCGS